MATQKERVLQRLRQGPLCSMEPLDWNPRITRTAARVDELKKKDGYNILSTECGHGENSEGYAHVVYRLVGRLEPPQAPVLRNFDGH